MTIGISRDIMSYALLDLHLYTHMAETHLTLAKLNQCKACVKPKTSDRCKFAHARIANKR